MNPIVTLALTLIPKVSRKTVQQIFLNTKSLPIDAQSLRHVFIDIKMKNARIHIPELEEISRALIEAERVYAESSKNGIQLISIFDNNYPYKLLTIQDPPVILFIKGNKNILYDNDVVAVIGTREPTEHGMRVAERFGKIFAENEITVVSGLAIGCDAFGHLGCVKAKGKAIAVMPCGLDRVYPTSNRQLAANILEEDGCLVSEYVIGTKPFKNYYIERDRLQSALSKAVVVVETDVVGGTMHTVKYTLEQKRILACYAHPEKYYQYRQTKGNRKLIDEKLALPLGSEIDIQNLLKMIKIEEDNIGENFLDLKKNISHKEVQLKFDDIMRA